MYAHTSHARTNGPHIIVPQAQLLQHRALVPLNRLHRLRPAPIIVVAESGRPVPQQRRQGRGPRVADVVVAVMLCM